MNDVLLDRPRPKIGEKAMFYLRDDIKALGTIVDIRADERGEMIAYIAVAGWPHMSQVPVRKYFELREGAWRSCSHPRGFNAAGLCFDCSDYPPVPAEATQ
jgi:hypothetical protein